MIIENCTIELIEYMMPVYSPVMCMAKYLKKYEQLAETEEDRGKTDINDIEDICVEHLSYGRNGVKIIKDVSFTFEKGRKYMLTGSSGSGKSTFLRLIGKLQEGTYQGNIRINGILHCAP